MIKKALTAVVMSSVHSYTDRVNKWWPKALYLQL